MIEYLTAIAVIFILMLGWLLVQAIARNFARRHPEYGPFREEGAGCGSSCGCANKGQCSKRNLPAE